MRLLRILALIALGVAAVMRLNAQVALGVRVGPHFSTVDATETIDQVAPDFRFTPGWNVAGVAEISFGDYFALQPEVHWMQKGFRFNEELNIPIGNLDIPAGADATFRSNYIEVPVLAKFKLGNDLVQAYAALGPSVGYAVNAEIITRPRLFLEFDPLRTDVNLERLDYERFEVSGTGVLGVQFNFSGVKVFADARYTHGFTELYDFPVINEKLRHRGISLGAGAMIDLYQKPVKKRPAVRPRA